MPEIVLNVQGNSVTATCDFPLYAGTVGFRVIAAFNSVWDGVDKLIVFRSGSYSVQSILDDNGE